MSTLPLRALHIPHVGVLPAVARVISVFTTAVDVFAEAQQMARAAHRRYPFIEG